MNIDQNAVKMKIAPALAGAATNSLTTTPTSWEARGFTLQQAISAAWQTAENRIFLPAAFANSTLYDFTVVSTKPSSETEVLSHLQHAIAEHFQLSANREQRLLEAEVLTAPRGKSPALKEPVRKTLSSSRAGSSMGVTDYSLSVQNATMREFADLVESIKPILVIDETHLAGLYSFDVRTSGGAGSSFASMLRDKLGLVLTKDHRAVDVLGVRAR